MIPIAVYSDRMSARPGETIEFKVSNATDAEATAKVVRVISADANPAGPGIRTEPVAAAPDKVLEPGAHAVPQGSYARIENVDALFDGGSFTVALRVMPTLIDGREQALVARRSATGTGGFALSLDATGRLRAEVGADGSAASVEIGQTLVEREWSSVWVAFDSGAGTLTIGHRALRPAFGSGEPSVASVEVPAGAASAAGSPLLLAAMNHESPQAHFNGRLEHPRVFAGAIDEAAIDGGGIAPAAHWDFSRAVSSSRIEDVGPDARHGVVVNSPARAMTGSNWTAAEMCWRHAPDEYAAIHFHEDDIDDCRWPTAFTWTVPADARSAVYAFIVEAGGESDNVPFHVVPPKGVATADIAVLASTFTYTIYGNHARPEWGTDPEWRTAWIEQSAEWGCAPHNPGAHIEYGLSTYNWHTDRSGISIASWHRPMLNMRLGYLTYPYESIRASGLRHFQADSHLLGWLEAKGHGYDVITDQELHDEGESLLSRYRVVLTGSHPEYHTPAMIEALENYRDGGGRFCYLGGNGFYWKIALDPERDGVIEIRRGEGGIRAWAAEPGEYYNQFDGEYGGMWRRNGRPPQHLFGIGFTAQGNFAGSYYRKREEAADPRVSWMFEGVDDETFGGHGFSAHGAAGFELDRADKRLGTPRHAVVVASSEKHPPDAPWVLVPEEMLTHITTWPGEPARDLIRADMTFFETPAGGAVFSTGSITFCGSLVTDGFDNDVSTLLDNVVRRFSDPAPFAMPDDA